MNYKELVEMWNDEFAPPLWSDLTEEQKIEFALNEGRRDGFVEIAEIASGLSEEPRQPLEAPHR